MKSPDSISIGNAVPSLFQIAAFFEDFFPSAGPRQPSDSSARHLPVAEYLLNPEKLMAVLRTEKTESPAPTAAPPAAPAKGQSAPAKRSNRGPQKKPASPAPTNFGAGVADGAAAQTGRSQRNGHDGSGDSPGALPKKIEFSFKSPSSNSVKLAGDFTDWEVHAIEMMRSDDGVWFTVVPLAPGAYAYRFIVDGEWRDDPDSDRRVPNDFGTQNAVVHVT